MTFGVSPPSLRGVRLWRTTWQSSQQALRLPRSLRSLAMTYRPVIVRLDPRFHGDAIQAVYPSLPDLIGHSKKTLLPVIARSSPLANDVAIQSLFSVMLNAVKHLKIL